MGAWLAWAIVLPVLCSVLYRLKGGLWSGKKWGGELNHVGTVGLGIVTAIAAGSADLIAAVMFIFLFWLGEKPGVGAYMGELINGLEPLEYEKWQVGPLKNPWLAVVARGLIWVGVTAPIWWLIPDFTVVFGLVPAMLLGAYFGRKEGWEAIEWFTGLFYGLWLAYTLI